MRKKGGDIHHRYILITYCDGIAWKKGYPHTVGVRVIVDSIHLQARLPKECPSLSLILLPSSFR